MHGENIEHEIRCCDSGDSGLLFTVGSRGWSEDKEWCQLCGVCVCARARINPCETGQDFFCSVSA